jgi:ectoine hydroxylase-related dioxygenase (phytanoyl-CoA dioxygenase family)
MNVHHDRANPSRITREPYGAPDWLCAIHYLTDVDENTPAFAVVPRSVRYEPLRKMFEASEAGEAEYCEQPLYGPAGTCVLYDTATYHTRMDSETARDSSSQIRRTLHQYYARGGDEKGGNSTTLTDWNVFPKRLADSPDPATKRFFSHWNTAMCEWAASDWSKHKLNLIGLAALSLSLHSVVCRR